MNDESKKILELIKQSNNILLHCHVGPDPDSMGSALAMKFALESMGKKATVIKGDSNLKEAFSSLPGYEKIVKKNFFEVNLAEFDLFIILDSGAKSMISKLGEVVFPKNLKTVIIDHHKSNDRFADICLIKPEYPACAQVVYDLFKEWNVKITREIALNLMAGLWCDSGGFQYPTTMSESFEMAAELTEIAPDFHEVIFAINNSNTHHDLALVGLGLSNIKVYYDGLLAVSSIQHSELVKHGIGEDVSSHVVVGLMKSVIGWDVVVTVIERKEGEFKVNFRTRDAGKYDLSAVAKALGGGGHRAAAGAEVKGTYGEVMKRLVFEVGKFL